MVLSTKWWESVGRAALFLPNPYFTPVCPCLYSGCPADNGAPGGRSDQPGVTASQYNT